jgi:hypothetical protein
MATETETLLMCSKCGKNPRADQDGTNPWCNPCKTKYASEYREMKEKQAAMLAYVRGAEAMRQAILGEFYRAPSNGLMMAGEVAQYIAGIPAPKLE